MLVVALAALALSASPAPLGRDETLHGGFTPLDVHRFGGVSAVLRYSVAEPDRDDTAYLFLSGGVSGMAVPSEVPVLSPQDELVRLRDSQGDCTLAHVELTAVGGHGEIIYAARTFSGDLKTDVNSEPGVMQVSVFRTVRGTRPGDAAVAFHPVGQPARSAPVCALKDVLSEMHRLSTTIRTQAKR